ncbi:MAG: hypothetical protein IPI02_04260 [Sterolibacteriaceae bacterium]|nr:hypothetical protein [Sterolibacteriaceae bacterium]
MLFALLAAFASPAVSGFDIKTAEVDKLDCKSYTLRVTGVANKGYCVHYSFNLTTGKDPTTTVTGSIPVDGAFDTSVNGAFSLATGGDFTGSGTASLKTNCQDGTVVNTVPIDFGGVTPVHCPTPPSPKVEIKKFTNGIDGDNANGTPTPGLTAGQFGTGNTVAEIPAFDNVTWTYRVTNTGSEPLDKVNVSDDRIGSITCPKGRLATGESMDCFRTERAEALILNPPRVVEGCGDKRPTYDNTGTVTAVGDPSGTSVEASNPSHYCNPKPPTCDLTLKKTCEIVQPPSSNWASCKGKLQLFTLIWPSTAGTINISGIANDAPNGVVNPGQKVTFSGPFSSNDLFLNISGAVSGQSNFHVSCSDKDMDGLTSTNLSQQQVAGKAQDCGKFEGDGKGKTGINTWLLDGLVDADGKVLNCSPEPTPPTSSCSFQPDEPPSCGTGDGFKPSTLTFQYTGGGCSTQSNSQAAGKTSCSGSIDPTKAVTVTASAGGGPFTVQPGGTFTINRDSSNTVFTLTNAGGGTETDGIHTSCSQPLIVGDVFFSLTLVAEDGVGPGKQVNYRYGVTNTGSTTASGISVVDDKLGAIGSIASVQPGQTKTLTKTTLIGQTTTNVATATADGACEAGVKAEATVTVLPPPPCSVTQTFDKIEDDKYKVKLTNTGKKVATLDTLKLFWPSNATYGSIKEVKLNGSIYKDDKSNLTVTSGVPITASGWTEADVAKRQLDPGKTQTLEIVFSQKWKKENCPNGTCVSGKASFAQGCEVDLDQ